MIDQTMCEFLTFWSASRQGALPAASILDVTMASTAMPTPLGPPAFEGMVAQDGLLAPQVDWVAHWGGAARSGIYRMRVQTSHGPVWFRVDHLALSGGDVSPVVAETVAEMEALVAPLALAETDASLPPLPVDVPADEISLLIVETWGQTLALPATQVLRVERPLSVWAVRAGQPSERQVALADGLMAGISLGQWLKPSEAVEAEDAWALVVAGEGGPVALLIHLVHGLVAVPRRCLRRMMHGSGESIGYLDPQRGAVEVLDPAELIGQRKTAPKSGKIGQPPLITPAPRLSGRLSEGRRGLETKRGLLVQAGPHACVLPSQMVLRVVQESHPDALLTRCRRGYYPLVDLALMLGLGPLPFPGRVLWIARRRRTPLAILVESVAAVEPDLVWRPLPVVPAPVRQLFSAVVHHGARCQWLIREDLFESASDPEVKSRIQGALRGWLDFAQKAG